MTGGTLTLAPGMAFAKITVENGAKIAFSGSLAAVGNTMAITIIPSAGDYHFGSYNGTFWLQFIKSSAPIESNVKIYIGALNKNDSLSYSSRAICDMYKVGTNTLALGKSSDDATAHQYWNHARIHLQDGIVAIKAADFHANESYYFEGGTLSYVDYTGAPDPSAKFVLTENMGPISIDTAGNDMTFAKDFGTRNFVKKGAGTLTLSSGCYVNNLGLAGTGRLVISGADTVVVQGNMTLTNAVLSAVEGTLYNVKGSCDLDELTLVVADGATSGQRLEYGIKASSYTGNAKDVSFVFLNADEMTESQIAKWRVIVSPSGTLKATNAGGFAISIQ